MRLVTLTGGLERVTPDLVALAVDLATRAVGLAPLLTDLTSLVRHSELRRRVPITRRWRWGCPALLQTFESASWTGFPSPSRQLRLGSIQAARTHVVPGRSKCRDAGVG